MSEWQPIETAPKDGTQIIGRNRDGECFECEWRTSEFFAQKYGGRPNEYIDGWFRQGLTDKEYPDWWAPMPSGPVNSEEAA